MINRIVARADRKQPAETHFLRVVLPVALLLATTAAAQDSPPLTVSVQRLEVGAGLRWSEVQLTAGEDVSWTAWVDRPWLQLAWAEQLTPSDRLSGLGGATLYVRSAGGGLEPGTYEGSLHVETEAAGVVVPVSMRVTGSLRLEVSETLVSTVPPESWSSPFAVPVDEVLVVPADEVAAALSQQVAGQLWDVRIVAVTAERSLYAAAVLETGSHDDALVWRSSDGGVTWDLLLRRDAGADCWFSVRLQAAALHPDGKRVFLGVTDGLFLDDRQVTGPPGLTNIDALHVSPGGDFLYAATQLLPGPCWRGGPDSDSAVYRGRFVAGSDRLEWEGGRSALVAALAPVAAIGSHPQDPNAAYLRAPSGAVFRKLLDAAEAYGWRRLDAADLPADLDFLVPRLAPATDFVRVPHTYARAYVPYVIDLHNGWGGYLFGRDGVAYAYYRGHHGGMDFYNVIRSRDGGVTWSGVWGASSFASRPTVREFLDARGHVGVVGTGSMILDPLDPLTTYLFGGSGDIIRRSQDGGGRWTSVGQGLPGASGPPRVAIDSVGTLYARFGPVVYARSVAPHPHRVTDVRVQPHLLRRGDRAVVTARVTPWPPGTGLPGAPPDDVRLSVDADGDWIDLHDDGVPPDNHAGDGLWTVAFTVDHERPFGFYGAIVAARTRDDPTRASARATFQVVPGGDVTVFADAPGQGWECTDPVGEPIPPSSDHARSGAASLRVEGEVSCAFSGIPLHPFSRTLDLWAFAPAGLASLHVEDARVDSNGIPAGRWVHLTQRAEALHAHPHSYFAGGGPEIPEPALLQRLRFRADAPVWLDEVRILDAFPDETPTAVTDRVRPPATALLPAYPNPFNSTVTIPFRLQRPGTARLAVYDVSGQRVRTLIAANLPAGDHRLLWQGDDDRGRPVASGLYLFRLTAGTGHLAAVKVLLLR